MSKKKSAKQASKRAGKKTAKRTPKKPSSKEKKSGQRRDSSPDAPFPIVGIGASAGGLEALDELFDHLPADTGMAFVVVTHQHPGHTSLLPELLGRDTEMPVAEAGDGMRLEPNHVYVCSPGKDLAVLNATLHPMEPDENAKPRLPIDYFFRSLAEDQGPRAICVVLSGTGSDGTAGVKAIKAQSGTVIVQETGTAKYAGMPSSAIATGLADHVLALQDMPEQLVAHDAGRSDQTGTPHDASEPPPIPIPTEWLQKIFVLLRSRTGHDFSGYKSTTLRRRIGRRMAAQQITDPEKYVRFLQEHPHEIDGLFKELLISVTGFFRDAAAWEALAEPLGTLLRSRTDTGSFRAWVPGCASGEEVFSLAIVIRELAGEMGKHFDVRVFGTDLDADSVESARAGLFPDGIGDEVSPDRLERYFHREDSSYRIREEIRDMTIFAPQNAIKDPPFTKLDLISCRNLLIYLGSDLQKKLLPIFHYALKPDGLLILGPSETIGPFTDLFEPVDKRWKIFRRKECATATRMLPKIPAQPATGDEGDTSSAPPSSSSKEAKISTQIERALLRRFAPFSVVVNHRGDIVHTHGRSGMFLELTEGSPRNNIIEMARGGLQAELASALRQCAAKGEGEVVRDDVRIDTDDGHAYISLAVAALTESESLHGLLLVTFQPKAPPESEQVTDGDGSEKSGDGGRTAVLERELRYLKESHQTTYEELETSNEELQSTNEELQIANEELETSKEEMQSLNEELSTVNSELQSKVEDLSLASDDMQNLLDSTDIATVFLDNDLNIKRFTPQVTGIVRLRESDIGRPISELAPNLQQEDLAGACRKVLKTLESAESEVSTKDGADYLMRIKAYRTTNNAIDGLVLTFVDIGPLKQAQRDGELCSFFERIFETVRQPLLVLDGHRRVVSANRYFCRLFRMDPEQVAGSLLSELGGGGWNIPRLDEMLEDVLPSDSSFADFEVDHEFPKIGRKVLLLNGRQLEGDCSRCDMILLAIEDVTGKNPD